MEVRYSRIGRERDRAQDARGSTPRTSIRLRPEGAEHICTIMNLGGGAAFDLTF
jgi:hypothetical protein